MLDRVPGNAKLVDYGIQSEQSDIRAHVCVVVERVYVYPTRLGIEAISRGDYRKVPVYTYRNNIRTKTAEGYLVPPKDIPRCVHMPIPDWLLAKLDFSPKDSTTAKGEKAVAVVTTFLRGGGFPLPVTGRVIKSHNLQVDGLDIYVDLKARIQVKCDYRGGPEELGGTGNLFLQTAECNPYRQH